jgi:hypothetical protein
VTREGAAAAKELLRTHNVHVVFTLPRQLSPLALQNKREIYALLFRASAETLLEIARDPRHLGTEVGFFIILHTWNQKLRHHPNIHNVVSRRRSGSGSLARNRLSLVNSDCVLRPSPTYGNHEPIFLNSTCIRNPASTPDV